MAEEKITEKVTMLEKRCIDLSDQTDEIRIIAKGIHHALDIVGSGTVSDDQDTSIYVIDTLLSRLDMVADLIDNNLTNIMAALEG